jgi:hypothetical protein
MSSRDSILKNLRQAQQPCADVPPIARRSDLSPAHDTSPEALKRRFIEEADKLTESAKRDDRSEKREAGGISKTALSILVTIGPLSHGFTSFRA